MRIRNNIANNPITYGIEGILSMILVIGIARTSFFQLCYLPLILAAKFTSGDSLPEIGRNYPPKFIRMISFVVGIILSEFAFSVFLIAGGELSFNVSNSESGWMVIVIELVLGIAVYLIFFGIATLLGYLGKKFSQPKKQ